MLSAWKRQTHVRTTVQRACAAVRPDRAAWCGGAAGQRAGSSAAGPGRHAARVPAGRRTERDLRDQGGPDAERRRAQADDRLGRRRGVRRLDAELRRARDRDPDRADRRRVHVPAAQRRRLGAVHRQRARDRPRRAPRRDGQGRRDPADRRPPRAAGQLLRSGRRPGAAAELAQARRQRLRDRPDLGAERRPRRARDRSRHEGVRGRRRHARRRAAARRRQPRLRPRQPAAGRLRAEGHRPGVDGRRPARADLGRRRRRPEQRDRRRRGVEAHRRQERRRPRRRDAHEGRRGPA